MRRYPILTMIMMTVSLVVVTAVARPRLVKNTVYDKGPVLAFQEMESVVGTTDIDPPARQVLVDIRGGGEMCAFTQSGQFFCDSHEGPEQYTLGLSTEPYARIVRLEFDGGPDGGTFSLLEIVR